MFTSDRDGVVGHVDGDNWRWAGTLMELAGFQKAKSGYHALPLDDLDRAREVMLALRVLAETAGIQLAPSPERYIGDFALDVIEHLPGAWTARVENYSLRVWQEDLAACLWSTGHVADTLDHHRVPRAAILKRDDGTELVVLKDPRLDVYHVGALLPIDLSHELLVTPPPGVTVQPDAPSAAHLIHTRLLPVYTRAVLHTRASDMADTLAWAHETFPDGTVPDPAPPLLVDAFARFTDSAPIVIAAVRDLGTLDEHETAFLQQADDIAVAPDTGTGPVPVAPHPDLLAWWLAEGGDRLVELALRTVENTQPAAAKAPLAAGPMRALPPAPRSSSPAPRR
ncbi:hypothetical protein [Streptomyces sp. CC208A]|uniref:hypothetical protein n=1 Tax=Streptomyces sp. CC208A TaxID=3044573 RepID=UPI0024A8EABE|nr:hypothetical protein [Streptomyces sp. CC208A]